MTHVTTRVFYPRALSENERSITQWLIEHAKVSDEEKKKYLSQLESATVIRMCDCGCASIDFAIDCFPSEIGGSLVPFGDYVAKKKQVGVFVYSKNEVLAGVEIYTMGAQQTPTEFPAPTELEPAVWEEEANQAAQTTPGLRPSVSDL